MSFANPQAVFVYLYKTFVQNLVILYLITYLLLLPMRDQLDHPVGYLTPRPSVILPLYYPSSDTSWAVGGICDSARMGIVELAHDKSGMLTSSNHIGGW